MIAGMFDHGALPALERLTQFTSRRHRVLADNIANLSTPYFKPRDLNPASFQAALREAIDQRRQSADALTGPLKMTNTDQLRFTAEGLEAQAAPTKSNLLFHDQNNRDLERIMQQLAENTLAHQSAVQLMRNQFEMLHLAIRERV